MLLKFVDILHDIQYYTYYEDMCTNVAANFVVVVVGVGVAKG